MARILQKLKPVLLLLLVAILILAAVFSYFHITGRTFLSDFAQENYGNSDILYGDTLTDGRITDSFGNIAYITDAEDAVVTEGVYRLLVSLDANQVLLHEGALQAMNTGDFTKLFLAGLIAEQADLDQVLVVSDEISQADPSGPLGGFLEGDQVSVETLLYGLLLTNGNDIALTLSKVLADTPEDAAAVLQERALALMAENTVFQSVTGSASNGNTSTLYDQYLLLQSIFGNKTIRQILSTESYTGTYQNASGETLSVTWESTFPHLTGLITIPQMSTIYAFTGDPAHDSGACVVYATDLNGRAYLGLIQSDLKREAYAGSLEDLFGNISN